MANLPAGAYRSGSIDYSVILDTDDLPIGYSVRGKDVYFPRTVTDSSGNTVGIAGPGGGGVSPILGVTSFTADDTGTAWAACPDIIQLGATLTAGGTTTVLIEVRTTAGAVSTAATITLDTLSQTLRTSFATRDFQVFRVRRSSGTGTVTVTL